MFPYCSIFFLFCDSSLISFHATEMGEHSVMQGWMDSRMGPDIYKGQTE